MSQTATPDTPVIVNDVTSNLGLPLPNPQNLMPADCMRIRQALVGLDAEVAKKLASSGGALSGELDIDSPNLSRDVAPDGIISGNRLSFRDANGYAISGLYARQTPAENLQLLLAYGKYDGVIKTSTLTVCFNREDGSAYAQCPPARGLYNNDIATMRNIVDYAVEKLTTTKTVYIRPSTGSDTADLYAGRGLTADKPFKSLGAAVTWAEGRYCGAAASLIYRVLEDITVDSIGFSAANFGNVHLQGDIPTRKITVTNSMSLASGVMFLENINLHGASTETDALFYTSNGATLVIYNNVTLSGMVRTTGGGAVLRAMLGGNIRIISDIAGNVTGRRYYCLTGGAIFSEGRGEEAIPGTIAGLTQTGGQYF